MSASAVTASTTVSAPPEAVFAILADPRQHAAIDGSGSVTEALSGPDRLELGSEFGMKMKQGASYRTANTVVEFEENRLIAWRHKAPHRWRYELEPQPDGTTRVTETWDISRWPGLLRPGLKLVLGGSTQRSIEQTLVKLKAAAEASVSG